ncbi:MAG: cytidyltransferase-related protein [uncultured bacterium]|nr:MAG: cytidyltransferase-related protein [uncultured bacterium]
MINNLQSNTLNNMLAVHSEYDSKIVTYEFLSKKITSTIKKGKKKIAQCHGVFDVLHIGHIKHLQHAKTFCDVLIVTITADKYVNKGLGRPYFPEHLRAQALAALSCVDYVVINNNATAVEAIKAIQPNFYVKGIEYLISENDLTGKITEEDEAVKSVGGQLRFTDDIVFSSSSLLNRFFTSYSPEIITYLDRLKQKYKTSEILDILNGAQKLNVLLIGESIIDIYHFGEAIGKAGKEPVLVSKYHREETYIGGVLAVANHLSTFCSKVTCLTALGEKGEYEQFIRSKLNSNVNVIFQYKKNSPTIIKRRYLEEYSLQKLFEIYEMNDGYLDDEQNKKFSNELDCHLDNYDLVIVADYGHGLLNSACVEKIETKSKFLAVNTQSNASNHGFNCVSKYKKADYVCIATRELQLNYRQKHISIIEQLNRLVNDHCYNNVLITNGRHGAYSYKAGEGIYEVPAFATSIKDRVGAGDAVLAVTSLCVALEAPAELVAFIGNIVGAEAVNIMGNESFIEKISLMKHITHLLK